MRLVIDGAEEWIDEALGNVADNLSYIKSLYGLTNKDIGDLAGVGEKTVWGWVRRKNEPTLSNLAPVVRALGIDLGDLISLSPDAFAAKYSDGGNPPFVLRVVPTVRSRSSSASPEDKRPRKRQAPAYKSSDSPFCNPRRLAA